MSGSVLLLLLVPLVSGCKSFDVSQTVDSRSEKTLQQPLLFLFLLLHPVDRLDRLLLLFLVHPTDRLLEDLLLLLLLFRVLLQGFRQLLAAIARALPTASPPVEDEEFSVISSSVVPASV
jgi:hypothetical protein